jgi:hypothetical protein
MAVIEKLELLLPADATEDSRDNEVVTPSDAFTG